MKRILALVALAAEPVALMATVEYSYEDDGKTYVATVTAAEAVLSDDAIAVLDANAVTSFVKRGAAKLIVEKGSVFTGDVMVEGPLHVKAQNALGAGPGKMRMTDQHLTLNGGSIAKEVVFGCGGYTENNRLMAWEGNFEFKEKFTFSGAAANMNIYPYANSRVTFSGGLEGDSYLMVREATGGTLVFSGTPVNISKMTTFYRINQTPSGGYGVCLEFAVAGNALPTIGNANYQDRRFTYAKLSTTVDWAFDNAGMAMNFGAGSLWDLCGTSQRVGNLNINRLDRNGAEGPLSVVTNSSATAASLYVTQTANATPAVAFGGYLSVDFSGNKTTTIGHAMTASGAVRVNNGRLAFTADGSWANAKSVAVASGAAVTVVSGGTFGRNTTVALEGTGSLSIAAGEGGAVVTQTVCCLSIDGEFQPSGFYEMGSGVLEVLYSGRKDVVDSTLTLAAGESFTLDDAVYCDTFDKVVLGDGATLDIETAAFFADDAEFELSLGSGATLSLASGIELYAKSATVGGVSVSPGRHTVATDSWLSGEGAVYVPYGAIAGTDVAWTGEGGDTLMRTAGNWAYAPDLSGGTTRAVFATGGGAATVTGSIFLNGLSFNTSGAFSVDASGGGAELRLASGGITTAGSATYAVSAPLTVEGDQTWNVGAATTISGAVGSDPLSKYSVHKTGGGELVVSGGGDFSGDVFFDAGALKFSGGGTFGNGSGRVVVSPNLTLVMAGATLDKDVFYNIDGGTWNGNNLSVHRGESTICGKVTWGNRSLKLSVYEGAHLTLRGGASDADASRGGYFYVQPNAGGTVVFTNSPVSLVNALYISPYGGLDANGFAGYIVFAVAGNRMPSLGYYTSKENENYRLRNCKMMTTVDWAFDNASQKMNVGENSVWDLCGTSQRVGNLDVAFPSGTMPVITSSSESVAALYLNQTADSTPQVLFSGRLSVDFTGNFTTTIDHAMTANGGVTVNSGTLSFVSEGSWRNATSVTVSGGARLSVSASRTFGRHTALVLESAESISLASGVDLRVGSLSVGGVDMGRGTFAFGDGTVTAGPQGMRIIFK